MISSKIDSTIGLRFFTVYGPWGRPDMALFDFTKNIIADVDVAGYAVSEAEVFPDGTQYRAFVLLEYNDLEANKIIVNRLRKDRLLYSKLRSNKAFQELDKAVDDIKIEESNQSEINLKLEELVPNDNMG